jgi:hypothetical protein
VPSNSPPRTSMQIAAIIMFIVASPYFMSIIEDAPWVVLAEGSCNTNGRANLASSWVPLYLPKEEHWVSLFHGSRVPLGTLGLAE